LSRAPTCTFRDDALDVRFALRENVRDKTFSEDLQRSRTGNQPHVYAAIRNLVIGAFRRAGYANLARARRYYARDDQRILALYGYA
jgi:hypothetical protein